MCREQLTNNYLNKLGGEAKGIGVVYPGQKEGHKRPWCLSGQGLVFSPTELMTGWEGIDASCSGMGGTA